jgi:hypothetical protein
MKRWALLVSLSTFVLFTAIAFQNCGEGGLSAGNQGSNFTNDLIPPNYDLPKGSDLTDTSTTTVKPEINWTRSDTIQDYDESWVSGPSPEVRISLYINPNGTLKVTTHNSGLQVGFPQIWHEDTPNLANPGDYECKIFVRQVDSLWPHTGYSSEFWFSNWQNLSKQVYYIARSTHATAHAGTVNKSGVWTLAIREVGKPDTVKYKKLYVSTKTVVK